MNEYFFWCGVIVNVIGAVALFGLLAWQAVEQWVKFNDIRGPLLRFYADELRRKKEAERAKRLMEDTTT